MLEIKITVELPGIPDAINHLADALLASKVQAITPSPAVVALPVVAETASEAVPEPAPAPAPEKKTRKRKEAPAPVEKAEDAPPLAEVPQEPVAQAEPEPAQAPADPEPAKAEAVSEATQEAAPDPVITQDIPADDGPVYNIDMLSRAGTALLDKGKMGDLLNLLGEFSAASLMDLKPEQYPAFAQKMKAIGADLP